MGLDQYAYEKTAATGEEGAEPAFIWRKHSKLQEFMENLYERRTGMSPENLNCGELVLTAGDIADLKAKVAGGTLPHSPGGFFYGHQFQDEAAADYLEKDLRFCAWAEARICEGATVCYSCWW